MQSLFGHLSLGITCISWACAGIHDGIVALVIPVIRSIFDLFSHQVAERLEFFQVIANHFQDGQYWRPEQESRNAPEPSKK